LKGWHRKGVMGKTIKKPSWFKLENYSQFKDMSFSQWAYQLTERLIFQLFMDDESNTGKDFDESGSGKNYRDQFYERLISNPNFANIKGTL